jgi:hypothetical protein
MKYINIDKNGVFRYSVQYSDPETKPENINDGSMFVTVESDVMDSQLANSYYDFDTQAFYQLPPKPDGFYNFDQNTKQWVADLGAWEADAKQKRQTLLYQSDWTQLSDAPVDRQAWANYRQHLRDITEQQDFPIKIDWGKSPDEV